MYCERCGAQNAAGSTFCIRCGAPLTHQDRQGAAGGENPVLLTIRGMLGGGLFLTCSIAFTLSLVLQLLCEIRGASQWDAMLSRLSNLLYMTGGYSYSPQMEMLEGLLNMSSRAVRSGHIIGTAIGMLPSILIAIGLWMLFASAKGQGPLGSGGLTMIRVICILAVVELVIVLLVLEVALIVAAVSMAGDYDGVVGIFVAVIIALLLVFGLIILYQAKLVGTAGVMRNAIQRGKPYARVSVFAAVMDYILGGVNAIGALAALVPMGPLSFLQSASMATALICFGILIFSYKSNMELLKQGAVPEIAKTAQPVPNQWREMPPAPHQNWQNAAPGREASDWGHEPQPASGYGAPVQGTRPPSPPETTVLNGGDAQAGRMAYVIRVKNGQRYPVTAARFRIGRNYDSELCIEDNNVVGRSHAEIVCHDGTCFLVDKHSSNHSYLNGMELFPDVEYKLDSGASFALGNEEFRFEQ